MLVKIQSKINDFYCLIDKHAENCLKKIYSAANADQGKDKGLDLDNDNNLYLKDNYLDKTKFFDENMPTMR